MAPERFERLYVLYRQYQELVHYDYLREQALEEAEKDNQSGEEQDTKPDDETLH